MLQAFGFDPKFCEWIKAILHSAKLSIAVNGKASGYFSCSRGVRQGDPLSPILFCLAKEVLSRGISKPVANGTIDLMTGARGFQVPSHILYADDVLVFCRASQKNINNLMQLFSRYGDVSGQRINPLKSTFYVGSCHIRRINVLARNLGFRIDRLPFLYLGIPIFKGKPRRQHLLPIVDRIKAKLSAWKASLLSISDRVILVSSVIHSMLTYSFLIYGWHVSLIKLVDRWSRNFIWGGDIDSKKLVTVAWHKVCKPVKEGGLGLRSIRQVNSATMLKL